MVINHEKCRCNLRARADLAEVKKILFPWKDTTHGKLFHEMQKVLIQAEKSTKAIPRSIGNQIIHNQSILPKTEMQLKYCSGCGNEIKRNPNGELTFTTFGGDSIYHHNCADTIRHRTGNP